MNEAKLRFKANDLRPMAKGIIDGEIKKGSEMKIFKILRAAGKRITVADKKDDPKRDTRMVTVEDLRKWFGKGPKGDWVRVGTDGKIKGDCAREPGEGKPKCMPRDKAHSMSKKDRGASARRKRRADPDVDRPGTGNKPIMVKTDKKKNESVSEAIDYFKVSKELSDYAKKHGGPDKREFEKAAAYVREIGKNSAVSVQDKAGKGLNMLFKNADTDVRDRLQMILTKGGFKVKGGYVMRESVELDENKLKAGDKVKTPQGTVEIKTRDTAGMRGKQDKFTMILHMKNGKKASMGSHPAPTASAVTNIAKRFDKGVPSYMAHLSTESVDLSENYRTLAMHGMGTEKKGEARVGLELDYYDNTGSKRMGKIVKVTPKGYIVKDDKDGKSRSFAFHDRAKAKDLLAKHGKGKYNESIEEARQMKDPKKDVMVVKNKKVIVIDKGKEKEYLKKGWQLAEKDLEEKNVPTNPALWAKMKSQAKAKFDVYPSAYANGWAAKKYKAAGGGWKTESVKETKSFWDIRE